MAAQVVAAMARARQTAELAELVGAAALSETDRSYLAYRTLVEEDLLDQGPGELRSLDDTLRRAWATLSALPPQELTMLSKEFLDRYLPNNSGKQ